MALELFNIITKQEVKNFWYPKENKVYLRNKINEIQKELGTSIYNNDLRKEEIKAIVKHFGKPKPIDDEDYFAYIDGLKRLDEW